MMVDKVKIVLVDEGAQPGQSTIETMEGGVGPE